jgi:K+-sensing histidine kinase KdpD
MHCRQYLKEEGPNIVIEEALSEKTVLITVQDNGSGIKGRGPFKNIYAKFSTLKLQERGLGLAMCKGIVEETKGNIWFQTTIGTGTTFFVELPIVPN